MVILCCFVLVYFYSSMLFSLVVLWEKHGKIRKVSSSWLSLVLYERLSIPVVSQWKALIFLLPALTNMSRFCLGKIKINFFGDGFWVEFFTCLLLRFGGVLWPFGEYGLGIKESENSGKTLLLKSARWLNKLAFPKDLCSLILKRDFDRCCKLHSYSFHGSPLKLKLGLIKG